MKDAKGHGSEAHSTGVQQVGNGMTKEAASQLWRVVEKEMSDKLVMIRPRLKDFEAYHIINSARGAIASSYSKIKSPEEFRATAFKFMPKGT